MKKKIISTMLTAGLLFSSISLPPHVVVEAATTQGEIKYGVNFRTSPSTSGSKIRMLQRGEVVEVIEEVNSYWYKVRDKNGRIGYVSTSSKYIETTTVSSPGSSANQGEIISGVNFRTQPSTSSSVIRMLKRGETVTIQSQVNDYWYQIRDKNGRTGYISTSSKYIKASQVSNPGSGSTSNQGEIIYGVNFRSQPSTSSGVIRMLQRGEVVTIQSKVNDYWYQIRDKNGRSGYISTSSKYIDTSYNGSGGSSKPSNPSTPGNSSSVAEKFIDAGMKYLGTPYEFGSDRGSTRTFDCSAFVRRAYLDATGIKLPMDSRQQADYVKKNGSTTTNWRNLERGDIMFFMDYKGTKKSDYAGINKSKQRISHNGIYLGNGKILHTYSVKSGGVRTDSIAGKHWEYRFVFGGSPTK